MILGNRIVAIVDDPFDAVEVDAIVRELSAESYRVEMLGRPGLDGPRRMADTMTDALSAAAARARPIDYCAMLVAGSALAWRSPPEAVLAFVRAFDRSRRPIAAASWGVEVLRAAGSTKDRIVAAPEGLVPALRQAGAEISSDLVAVDGPLITSRDRRGAVLLADTLVERLADLYGAGDLALDYA